MTTTRRPVAGLFVTGTDTGVGKTWVSTSLVHALVSHGLRVAVMKPVASGSQTTEAGLRNEDALSLIAASNLSKPYAAVNPYCFAPPISPHIAAEEARISVDRRLIKERFDALAADADFVLVEGAGGWCVPLGPDLAISDLPGLLQIPVLLVVGVRLGCLNHATLSKRAIEADGAEWAGWAANRVDPAMLRPEENLKSLVRLLGSEPLADFPFEVPAPGAVTAVTPALAESAQTPAGTGTSRAPAATHAGVSGQRQSPVGRALHVRQAEQLARRLLLISF